MIECPLIVNFDARPALHEQPNKHTTSGLYKPWLTMECGLIVIGLLSVFRSLKEVVSEKEPRTFNIPVSAFVEKE